MVAFFGSMPGRKRAGRLELTAGSSDRLLNSSAIACAIVFVLGASVSNCGFPEYDFAASGASGTGALGGGGASGGRVNGGAAGNAGQSGSMAGGGTSGGGGGGGGDANAGDAGAAGAAGTGGDDCIFPVPVIYPAHCFDKTPNGGESGVDCGGTECASCTGTEACAVNTDCASGVCPASKTCSPVLSLEYMSIDANAFTRAPKFKLVITYLSATSTELSDLSIRYYFNHNGVAEPVIALDGQATYDPGAALMDISNNAKWLIYREPLGPQDSAGHKTDSYVEVTFKNPSTVSAGGKLELTQDIVAGNDDLKFDQVSHYSFLNAGGLTPNNAITVYRAGQRVWGVEPPMVVVPACAFARGVNLGGGPAVTIEGDSIVKEGDEQWMFSGTTYSNDAAKALPVTDSGTTTLLKTAQILTGGDTALWSALPNGKYWAYAWLTSASSASGATSGTLALQGNPQDKFVSLQTGVGAGWSLAGPYRIDVTDNTLALSVSGTVNVAGMKLYHAE